jgi:orotate phosphoribosyltransferase
VQKKVNLDKLGTEILQRLRKERMILTWLDNPQGDWYLLSSGSWAPFYINLRRIYSYPDLADKAESALVSIARTVGLSSERHEILGIAMNAIPMARTVSKELRIPMLYTRPEKHLPKHGVKKPIEGDLFDGREIAFVEDVVTQLSNITRADTELKEMAQSEGVSITTRPIIALIDRSKGTSEKARSSGYELHSAISFPSKIGCIGSTLIGLEYQTIQDFLENPQKYQDRNVQEEIIERSIRDNLIKVIRS